MGWGGGLSPLGVGIRVHPGLPAGDAPMGTRPQRRAVLRSVPTPSSSLCSFPLPICAHPLVSQRIILKTGTWFKGKDSKAVGSLVLGLGCWRREATSSASLTSLKPEEVTQPDRQVCLLLPTDLGPGVLSVSASCQGSVCCSLSSLPVLPADSKRHLQRLIIRATGSEHECSLPVLLGCRPSEK